MPGSLLATINGSFFSAGTPTGGVSAGVAIAGQNNVIKAWRFTLPAESLVKRLIFEITTGGTAGAVVDFGLYDLTGRKVISAGGVNTGASTTVRSVLLASPVYIPRGEYLFCWVANETAVKCRGQSTTNGGALHNGGDTKFEGTIATAAVNGVLPDTIAPAITASDVLGLPSVFFSNES